MAAQAQITDRGHRYRAQKLAPNTPKVCAYCGSTRNIVPDHIDGVPDHTVRSNLQWLCKSCNTAKGAAFAKAGKGRLTHQYNPAKGEVPTLKQYAWAVSNHTREAHDEAGAIIHATPPALRSEYARAMAGKSARTKREMAAERWNPARKNPAEGSADVFEEFHGYEPSEVIVVQKKVFHHKHLAAAGELAFLAVWGVDGKGHKLSGFDGAVLAFNERKNQLFVEGGDQAIKLSAFGISAPHEWETLGKVVDIGYATNKTHLGDEGGEALYVHKFRSTNRNGRHVTIRIARYPDLIYDVRNEQLLFSGGSYEILREGINK